MTLPPIPDARETDHRRSGFTLVLTVSILVLLAVIAIGLLSLSTVTVRAVGRGEAQAQARANARMALILAIGDLQKMAGPDTRVTGNAQLIDRNSPNPNWLGVWKTRPGENLQGGEVGTHPIGNHRSQYYLSDLRGSTPASPERWLVSSPEVGGAAPGAVLGDDAVILLETESAETTVRVPSLPIGDQAGCAWWVADESQKALLNLTDRHENLVPRRGYSLAAAQDFDFEDYRIGSGRPLAGKAAEDSVRQEAVVTLATAGLLELDDPETYRQALAESYHHLTTDSIGLFTDVKNSGLKQDLSAFLALGEIPDEPLTGLAGLKEEDPILPGRYHVETSPRYGILKGWADLAEELDADSGMASLDPQPPSTYYQTLQGSAAGPVRDLTNVSKPAIQPVVVEASLGWDFSPYKGGADGVEFLRGHLYPRVILWNPFNVTLKATRYVVMLRHPLYSRFTARGELVNSRSDRLYFGDLCGNPEEAFLGFVIEETELLPGETKVFTPDVVDSGGASLAGRAAEFDPVDYASNILTADQIPGVENFYYDSDVLLPAETPANRYEAYGFSANTNSFYGTPGHTDEFIVTQVMGGGDRIGWNEVTANNDDFPRIHHFLAQNWGLNRYHKWYGAEKSNHPSNNGTPFREFRDGAPDIGAIDNRRPPRLWRRGVRMAWFDDRAEYIAGSKQVPKSRYTHPWFSASNIRGGLQHHSSWVSIPFAPGWQLPAADGHFYFRQPTDPQLLSNFFPPSPIAAPDAGFPSVCTIYDIPRRDTGIISMGQLQHAQLSYSTWHPSFVIGHSQATMNADLDATAIKRGVVDRNRWRGSKPWDFDNVIQKGRGDHTHNGEVLVYDLCYEANEALWDRFMLSSIPYDGDPASRRVAWVPEDPLPVGRYVFNDSSRRYDRESLAVALEGDPALPYFRAAEFLVNRGAFNVNSTSVEAWRALLGNMRGLQREAFDGESSEGDHPFSRSLLTPSAGGGGNRNASDPEAWNTFRSLSDEEVGVLAEQIVEQVRARGPFLSIADFVNRRLGKDEELASAGALDQAIRRSGVINAGLEEEGPTDLREIGDVPTASNRSAAIAYGIPGFVTQGDLLSSIAPVITARGDTFRIRAYGEALGRDGKMVKAWCEAVVQRGVAYVDSSDDPALPAIDNSGRSPEVGDLKSSNLAFGRRFNIISFRWLPPSELSSTT